MSISVGFGLSGRRPRGGVGSRLLRSGQQRREHFLQASDEMVGLSSSLGKVFGLVVLDADLLGPRGVRRCELWVSRDLSRRAATGRDVASAACARR
jgi:hypothetical protein